MLEGAKLIGAGAATIASAGAAVGSGNVFSSLIHSVARNPLLTKKNLVYAILGFALTEAIALFAIMMTMILLVLRKIMIVGWVVAAGPFFLAEFDQLLTLAYPAIASGPLSILQAFPVHSALREIKNAERK